ncbi:SDR family NAD(P)-dependent oxidoreductase [Caulobacter segnis]|uniref:Short-chain dehydrogenase n=1 Tax=Caulobacter segnis TaxID=88688 RepID=A0A2W5V826_9CAUL|nr:SDR family NAD(P)-dependent oxidoreductase [Caulobacter segnis]PZR32826.1 MAG: short-chain dehydrogenase [Caulobacter segnis]
MAKYSLEGRVVVITGANGGLGSALAKALAKRGAKLALLDIAHPNAGQIVMSFGGAKLAQTWEVDVRSMDSVNTAIKAAADHFGKIDIVIANAGVTAFEPLVHADPKTFDRVIDINLNGVWRTFRAAVPYVAETKGYLLGISSMAAFMHSPLQASYTASKAGVWALCDSIRLELRHQGVGVGSAHPTFFHTPLMDQTFADPAGNKIWGGNKGGIFKMVSLEEVISSIVEGIERRQDVMVIPKTNGLVARAPGLFRKIVEAIGFNDRDIAETVRVAGQKGGVN